MVGTASSGNPPCPGRESILPRSAPRGPPAGTVHEIPAGGSASLVRFPLFPRQGDNGGMWRQRRDQQVPALSHGRRMPGMSPRTQRRLDTFFLGLAWLAAGLVLFWAGLWAVHGVIMIISVIP